MFKSSVILLFLLGSAWANVIDLSGYAVDEFKREVENYDSIFIKFYAPYCGHCKSMAQDFVKTAKKMADEDPPVVLAEVDCTSATGTKICSKYNVRGYPSLKLFKQGSPYKDYEGQRMTKDLTEWLKKHAKEYSKRFTSFTDLNHEISRAEAAVVTGIFEDMNDEFIERWMKAAKKVKEHWHFRDIQFFHIFEEHASGSSGKLTILGLSEGKSLKSPTIILTRPQWLENKYEPKSIVYNKKSKQDLAEWVFRKAFGLVLYRSRETMDELHKPPVIVAYYDLDFKRHHQRTHFWRNRLMKKATEHPDLNFAISSSMSFRKILRRKDLVPPVGDEPPLLIAYDLFGTEYVMRDNFTMETFEEFLQQYKKGEVWPHLKSEQVPEVLVENNVKIAVGILFHRMVTFNPKDVFINFYAPWCIHSKELLPIWEEVATQLKDEPDLDVIKMNAVGNEVPSLIEVPQYPTVYFIPKTTKQLIKYDLGKNLHEFLVFVARHATQELLGFHRNGRRKTLAAGDDPASRDEL